MKILIDLRNVLCGLMLYAFLTLTAYAQIPMPVSSLPNGFPTNDASEGKLIASSQGLSSLGAPPASGTVFNVHIRVPITTATLSIQIFDPDLYSDADPTPGNTKYWDFPALNFTPGLSGYQEATRFELYPDVNVAGNTTTGELANLLADSSMDNKWADFPDVPVVTTDAAGACEQGADAKFCYYHLVARWVDPLTNIPKFNATTFGGNVLNGFIVASNGLPFLAKGSTIGIIGMTQTSPAFPVPATNYDGVVSLRALVASAQECALDIYDGDSDRYGEAGAAVTDESDDPNTPNDGIATGFFPFSLSGDALEEGIRAGNPRDNSNSPSGSIGVPVFYTVDPEPPTAGYDVDCCVNDNPSGDLEWELYRIASSTPGCPDVTNPNYDPDDHTGSGGLNGSAPVAVPDEVVNQIAPGFHNITFTGMDQNNLNFLNVSADIFAGDAFDYGDAPDSYETTQSNNGAFHDIDSRLTLGVEIDAEFDGDPTVAADGDDVNLLDDEDGVSVFNKLVNNMGGGIYEVDLAVRNELDIGDSAMLYGWIDFDRDLIFNPVGESASVQVNPGNTNAKLVFTIPSDISAGTTYARFRLTSDFSVNTTTPGGGATNGEVEDYMLTIERDKEECIPCIGMKKLTFKMSSWDHHSSVQRDPNETVRIRVGDLGGRFSGTDFNAPVLFEGRVANGGIIDVNVPDEYLGKTLTISVEGRYHAIEYGKAVFNPNCDLKLYTRVGSSYIEFKVIGFEKNSEEICECIPCKGMKKVTLKMSSWDHQGSVQRDPNETVRVRVGDLGGRFSGTDFNAPVLFEGRVANGGIIDVNVPDEYLGKTLTISVEGRYHAIEYGKAVFNPNCDLKLYTRVGSSYIEFKVIGFEKNSEQICECVPDPESGVTCPPTGEQGCTPGYWKQPHHFDSWVGYSANDKFRDAFKTGSRQSLLYTLSKGGGGGIAFRRHATAALLNATNPDVNYFQTESEVLASVKDTYSLIWRTPKSRRKPIWEAAKDIFEQQNELGCPLN